MKKTQIYVLGLTSLKNDKHIAIAAFMADAIKKFSLAETVLAPLAALYLVAYDKEEKAFMRIDREELTKALNEADTDRINALRVLRDMLRTFLYRKNEVQKAQAQRVLDVIDKYGGTAIFTQPVDSRTGNITNIIFDLEKDLSEAITALDLTSFVVTLKEANSVFLQNQSARVESDAEYGKNTMANARVETDSVWRAIVEMANSVLAYGSEEDSEALEPFARYMNVEIDSYRIQNGQGVGGSSSSSENVQTRNATFEFANGNVMKFKVVIGAPLEAQENTPGYIWRPEVDKVMPAKNIVYREVKIDEAEVNATFHFFNHREEVIKQLVGSVLHAPANTNGYYWYPNVPAKMPAGDTSYYELPNENSDSGNNGGNNGGNDNTGGGNTDGGNTDVGNTDSGNTGNDNSGNDNSGGSTETPSKYTITFRFYDNSSITAQYAPGQRIDYPRNSYGYAWPENRPDTMPAEDITVTEVPDKNDVEVDPDSGL